MLLAVSVLLDDSDWSASRSDRFTPGEGALCTPPVGSSAGLRGCAFDGGMELKLRLNKINSFDDTNCYDARMVGVERWLCLQIRSAMKVCIYDKARLSFCNSTPYNPKHHHCQTVGANDNRLCFYFPFILFFSSISSFFVYFPSFLSEFSLSRFLLHHSIY